MRVLLSLFSLLALLLGSDAGTHSIAEPLLEQTGTVPSRTRCSQRPGARPLDTTTEIGRLIQADKEFLDARFKFASPVCICDSGGTVATPQGEIYVDVAELKEIQTKSKVKYFELGLRFALAHEKVHEFQDRTYNQKLWDTRDPARLRVMECQADLYAAHIVGLTFREDDYEKELAEIRAETGTWNLNINLKDPKDIEKLDRLLLERNPWKDIWYAALDMGEARGIQSDHPTGAQRATAFDTGFWLGSVERAVVAVEEAKRQGKEIRKSEKEELAQWATDIWSRFGFQYVSESESTLKFALEEARRITRYSDGSLEKIQITNKKIKWDPGKNEDSVGVVHYAVNFRNRVSRMIHVDTAVQLVYTADWEPYDPELTFLDETRRSSFTLKPRESREISGRFSFIRNYRKDWGPALVTPSDEQALITSEYVRSVASSALH